MSDRWTDRLSEYVDGELGADERRQLEDHLADCAECSETVEGLRRVVAMAGSLENPPPADDLWTGIADRIGVSGADHVIDMSQRRGRARAGGRRFAFSLPQLVAASVVLVLVSAGGAWYVTRSQLPDQPAVAERTAPNGGRLVDLPAAYRDDTSDMAIAELQQVLRENRDRLDPETIRSIEDNLDKINRAIHQARRALAEDPASDYLNEHLAKTMQQKLEFLRETTAMVAAS